jgi:hypothetical protein
MTSKGIDLLFRETPADSLTTHLGDIRRVKLAAIVVQREELERRPNLLICGERFFPSRETRYPQKYPQLARQVHARRVAGSGVLPGRLGLWLPLGRANLYVMKQMPVLVNSVRAVPAKPVWRETPAYQRR